MDAGSPTTSGSVETRGTSWRATTSGATAAGDSASASSSPAVICDGCERL